MFLNLVWPKTPSIRNVGDMVRLKPKVGILMPTSAVPSWPSAGPVSSPSAPAPYTGAFIWEYLPQIISLVLTL